MSNSRKVSILVIVIVLWLALLTVLYQSQDKERTVTPISLQDLKGNEQLITFQDKPTAILFFTSWCPYCNEDAPKVVSIYEKYKNDINLYGINLINRDERIELDRYVEKYHIDYPVLLDEDSKLYKKFGSPGFPTLVFFDKNGRETKRMIGSTSQTIIDAQFKKALTSF